MKTRSRIGDSAKVLREIREGLARLADMIPSHSILVIIRPETIRDWNDPHFEDRMERDQEERRSLGCRYSLQCDYAKWGWLQDGPYRRPSVIVTPATLAGLQTMEALEFVGIIAGVHLQDLNVFRHDMTWDTTFELALYEDDYTVLVHFWGYRRSLATYLHDSLPAVMHALDKFYDLERLDIHQPLTFILPPIYAQLFAWGFSRVQHRRLRGHRGTEDIVREPFYGCDAILVTPDGVSILRSGWGSGGY